MRITGTVPLTPGEQLAETIADMRREIAELQRAAAGGPEAWHYIGDVGEPAFQTGWANFGGGHRTARYRKVGDDVTVEGLVVRSSGTGASPFTLPAGYRPPLTVLSAHIDGGNTLSRIDMQANGQLVVVSATTSLAYLDINLRFTTSA